MKPFFIGDMALHTPNHMSKTCGGINNFIETAFIKYIAYDMLVKKIAYKHNTISKTILCEKIIKVCVKCLLH